MEVASTDVGDSELTEFWKYLWLHPLDISVYFHDRQAVDTQRIAGGFSGAAGLQHGEQSLDGNDERVRRFTERIPREWTTREAGGVARQSARGVATTGVWVVYFEADSDCMFMDATYAIDTIQVLGAKVIWITPKTRRGPGAWS